MTNYSIGILYRAVFILCISTLSGLKWGWLSGGLVLSCLLLFFDIFSEATKTYVLVNRANGTSGGRTADGG